MKRTLAAFTLIELLVVIAIIAILASFALPAYTAVQERAQQTKDLSNAKQITLALKQFATDNNGNFPSKAPAAGDYGAAPDVAPGTANDAFWWLFPNYLQSEDIFVVAGSKWTPANPDNVLDPNPTVNGPGGKTLAAGENSYAYILALTDTSNPAFPLVADGFADPEPNPPAYDTSKSNKGGVWAAKKAIVGYCDASAQILKVDPTSKAPMRLNGTANLFAPGADWLVVANVVVNPK